MLAGINKFDAEIKHFVDCCLKEMECIVKTKECIILMDIINAIYKSAEIGKAIEFDDI